MGITELPTFDECERPVCPDNIFLEFVDLPDTICHLETSSVSWRIRESDDTPTSTEIHYSLNSSSLENKVGSSPEDGYYSPGDSLFSLIPFPGASGTLNIRAAAVINGAFYFSETRTIIVEECEASCFPEWKVDPTTPNNKITEVYFEFKTGTIPDQMQVLGNYNKENCSGNILYDTGCTSTTLALNDMGGEKYPGTYPPTLFNSGVQEYSDDGIQLSGPGVWYDCFQIHESDFPLGVKISPNCSGSDSSSYSLYMLGPTFDLFYSSSSSNQDVDCIDVKDLTATIR